MHTRKRATAGTAAAAVLALLLMGCSQEAGVGTGGPCDSHYRRLAHAPTRTAVREQVLFTAPHGSSLRPVGRSHGHASYQLLNAHGRMLMQVDLWRLAGGGWVAGQWMQCID